MDRGKRGIKRSMAVDAEGIPLGSVAAPANRHDSPLLVPTLEAEPGGEGDEPRYKLLEPVRQFALEELEEVGEGKATRRASGAFFLDLAERAEPEIRGHDQVEWLETLEQENGNLRATMGWALSQGDAETAARLGWALWLFWWYRGHHREGRRWIEAVLEQKPSPTSRTKALMVAGSLSYGHGDYEQSEKYCRECLTLSRQLGDERRTGWARAGLGLVAMSRSDHEEAAALLEAALQSLREVDEEYGVALVSIFLGMLALMDGDEDRATPMFEEGLAIARRLDVCC